MNYNEACQFIKSKLGMYYIPDKVDQHLRTYKKRGLSYDEIVDRVRFWYDYSGEGDPAKSGGGIAILSYIETRYLEWKKEQTEKDEAKSKLKDFKLKDEEPIQVAVKIDKTFKLPEL